MAKPELGTKRLCASCSAKFYDLNKDPIHCPKCGAVYEVVMATRPVWREAAPVAPRPPVPEEAPAPEPQEVHCASSAHRVTGVASFILLADIGDQRLRTLHLNFEGGDQRVFRVNDNVSRFPLKFKANRKLHLCALPISVKSSTIQLGGVKLTKLLNRCRHLRSNLGDWPGMPPS